MAARNAAVVSFAHANILAPANILVAPANILVAPANILVAPAYILVAPANILTPANILVPANIQHLLMSLFSSFYRMPKPENIWARGVW